jgi:PEP-CTERM motif
MMSQRLLVRIACLTITCVSAADLARAAVYSPSQAQLNSLAFTDFWPGNGATLNSKTFIGADAVQFNFNTGFPIPQLVTYSQSQFEAPFSQNLTGFSEFGIDFQVAPGGSINGSQLEAQVYLRYSNSGTFAPSSRVAIGTSTPTHVALNLGSLPPNALGQITAFGIALSSDDPFTADPGDKVIAFKAPQPTSFSDGQNISDFEGSDPGSWVSGFQPDHTQTIVTSDGSAFNNGVTKGTHALQINRTFTGTDFPSGTGNLNVRWGSQMVLNAAANPADQSKINTLVDAINAAAPNGRIAFDVSFKNVDHFPNSNPDFLGFGMFISDGIVTGPSSPFYQADFAFPPVPAIGDFYKTTLSVPISMFKDQSVNHLGNLGVNGLLLHKNSALTFGILSNTNGNASFVIDNIRVQNAVPEPASAVLFAIGAIGLATRYRRPIATDNRQLTTNA